MKIKVFLTQRLQVVSHLLRLSEQKPQVQLEAGSRLSVTKSNFPMLQGMSFYKLTMQPLAVREPHWHANADELGYCLSGSVLVSFYASGNQKESFVVESGDAFFIPSGTLHDVETVGNTEATLILQFSHEEPEDFSLSTTVSMFSNAVLGNTWNVPSQVFESMPRQKTEIFFGSRATPLKKTTHYPSPYHFSLNQSAPLITYPYGSATVARQNVWPILRRQALYSLVLTGDGMREPHWHPETAEMGYIEKGSGRMSIQSPNGNVDTYVMNEGDLYFIPKAYPHHIECLTDSLHILIFFDQAMPGDIGFTGSIKSFSSESIASVLKTPVDFINRLPTYDEDLFIVKRINPLDNS